MRRARRWATSYRRLAPWWRRFRRNGYRVDRCHHCGHRFRWTNDARFASGNRDGIVYHGPCSAYLHWRRRATERLAVLDTTADLAGLSGSDVQQSLELTAPDPVTRARWSSRAWRVFHDLEQARANAESVTP